MMLKRVILAGAVVCFFAMYEHFSLLPSMVARRQMFLH
jgi:hypothetical protein